MFLLRPHKTTVAGSVRPLWRYGPEAGDRGQPARLKCLQGHVLAGVMPPRLSVGQATAPKPVTVGHVLVGVMPPRLSIGQAMAPKPVTVGSPRG